VIRHKNDVLDGHCRDIGRDPEDIERSCGAPPHKIERADELVEAGATMFTLAFDGDTRFDFSPVADWLAWRDDRNGE
jgi:hypothetical protein